MEESEGGSTASMGDSTSGGSDAGHEGGGHAHGGGEGGGGHGDGHHDDASCRWLHIPGSLGEGMRRWPDGLLGGPMPRLHKRNQLLALFGVPQPHEDKEAEGRAIEAAKPALRLEVVVGPPPPSEPPQTARTSNGAPDLKASQAGGPGSGAAGAATPPLLPGAPLTPPLPEVSVILGGAEIVSSPLLWQLMQDWCAPVDLAFGCMPGAASLEREQLCEVVYVAEQILRRPWWVAEAVCTNLLKVFSVMLEALGGAVLRLDTTAPLELAGRLHAKGAKGHNGSGAGAGGGGGAAAGGRVPPTAGEDGEVVRVTIPALSAVARPELGPPPSGPPPVGGATGGAGGGGAGGGGKGHKDGKEGGRDGAGHGKRRGSILGGVGLHGKDGHDGHAAPPPPLGRRQTTVAAAGGSESGGGGGGGGDGGVGVGGGSDAPAAGACGAQLELTLETRGPLRVRVPRMSPAQFASGRKGLKEAALLSGAPHYYDESSLLPAMAEMRARARERQRELHEERARRRLDHAARYVQRFHRNSLRHRRRTSMGGPADSFFSAVHRLSQHSYVRHSMAGPALARLARDGRRSVVAAPRGRWNPFRSLVSWVLATLFSIVAYVTGVCTFVLATMIDLALLPVTLPLAMLGLRPLSFARGRSGPKRVPVRRRRGRGGGYMKRWRGAGEVAKY